MCKQKSIASTWLIHTQSFEWQMEHKYYNKMIRMHYHSKMLDDDNGVACVMRIYVFRCILGCIFLSNIGILCDIDTCIRIDWCIWYYYVWCVDLMVMLSRFGKPDKVQYPFNSVYCVGFSCTCICVHIQISHSVSLVLLSLSLSR